MSLWIFPFFEHSFVKLVMLVIWISPLISFVTDLTTEELSQEGLCPLSHHSLSFEHSNGGALLFLIFPPWDMIWKKNVLGVTILPSFYHNSRVNQNVWLSHFWEFLRTKDAGRSKIWNLNVKSFLSRSIFIFLYLRAARFYDLCPFFS